MNITTPLLATCRSLCIFFILLSAITSWISETQAQTISPEIALSTLGFPEAPTFEDADIDISEPPEWDPAEEFASIIIPSEAIICEVPTSSAWYNDVEVCLLELGMQGLVALQYSYGHQSDRGLDWMPDVDDTSCTFQIIYLGAAMGSCPRLPDDVSTFYGKIFGLGLGMTLWF